MNPTLIKAISTGVPRLAVSFSFNKLTNPQVKKLREHETIVLERADQEDFPFKGFTIKLYRWGQGSKKSC